MSKRNLMTQAHKIAKSIVATVGDYMVAMKIALKKAWGEMKMAIEFGVAENGKRYVEAAADSINVGDTLTKEFRVDAVMPTKKNLRLGKEIKPAATVIRTYKVTGAGQVFFKGDPSGDHQQLQRFYCDVTEQRIYDEE